MQANALFSWKIYTACKNLHERAGRDKLVTCHRKEISAKLIPIASQSEKKSLQSVSICFDFQTKAGRRHLWAPWIRLLGALQQRRCPPRLFQIWSLFWRFSLTMQFHFHNSRSHKLNFKEFFRLLWFPVWHVNWFLSDSGPIIVYPCQQLTHELVETWMIWP